MVSSKCIAAALLVSVASALLIGRVQATAIVASPSIYLPFMTRAEGATTTSPSGPPIVIQAPVLTNGDFELADTVWTEFASDRRKLIRSDKLNGIVPQSGRYLAKLGGTANETSAIVQWFEIPRKGRELVFSYQIRATAAQTEQVGEVDINGQPLALYNLSSATQTDEWQNVRLDIEQYAGKKITLRFQLRTASVAAPAEWYIDDVRIP